MAIRSVLVLLAVVTPVPGQDLAEVFARVSPSVVTIRAIEARVTGGEKPRLEEGTKTGSGVLLDKEGTELTAAHVVELADEVLVEFSDGTKRQDAVVAAGPEADLALVRVSGELPVGVEPGTTAVWPPSETGNSEPPSESPIAPCRSFGG